MAQQNEEQNTVSDSKFNMVRCLVAMAHADGDVSPDEWEYVTNMIKHLPLNQRQKDVIAADMDRGEDAEVLLESINNPEVRAEVIYFARLMAHKDGIYDPNEEQLLNQLHKKVVEKLDMDAIREDVRKSLETELVIHDAKSGDRPNKGLFWLVDQALMKLGIDLMD